MSASSKLFLWRELTENGYGIEPRQRTGAAPTEAAAAGAVERETSSEGLRPPRSYAS